MENTSDKNKKKKKKGRKITFLRGKDDIESMDSVKPVGNQEFVKFFKDLIQQHSEYVPLSKERDQKKGGDKSEEEKKERVKSQKCLDNPLRTELVIGLSAIMRKIQRKEIIGVILTDPLTIHLQATIYDLCREFEVAFLLVSNFQQLDEILGISKLTSVALTEKVTQPTSPLHDLYQIFIKYAKKFDQTLISRVDPCLSIKPAIKLEQEIKEEASDKPVVSVFKFNMPPAEQFYIPSDTSYDTVSIKKELESQQSKNCQEFITINNEQDDYFPQRLYFHQLDVNLSWCIKDKSVKKSTDLGQKLFIPDEIERWLKKATVNKTIFKEPKVVQLPCSGKDKKRFRNKKKKPLKY